MISEFDLQQSYFSHKMFKIVGIFSGKIFFLNNGWMLHGLICVNFKVKDNSCVF